MDALPKVPISLEPVYKDDDGNIIQNVHDILIDFTHIYEPPHNPATTLRRNLGKIEAERGGISNITIQGLLDNPTDLDAEPQSKKDEAEPAAATAETGHRSLTIEQLEDMRVDILTKLEYRQFFPSSRPALIPIFSDAMNNTSAASEALELLLSKPDPNFYHGGEAIAPGTLTTTTVMPNSFALPAAQPSVKAMNSKIVVGTKDRTLRRASNIFQAAAERTANVVEKGERYWETAVRLRRNNWPLLAAPLRNEMGFLISRPVQGADNFSRDFRISYGLEQSAPKIRRDALATVKVQTKGSDGSVLDVKGPSKRLRLSLVTTSPDGEASTGYMQIPPNPAPISEQEALDQELEWAQAASVEDELYDEVLKEAAHLPSVSARIGDKRMDIDCAVDATLRFEMIDSDDEGPDELAPRPSTPAEQKNSVLATLIYHSLLIFLIRAHRAVGHVKTKRTELLNAGQPPAYMANMLAARSPPILAPILSLLQYHSFVNRIRRIITNITTGLTKAGVKCKADVTAVGDDITTILAKTALYSGPPPGEQPAPSQPTDYAPKLETAVHSLMLEREDLLRVTGEASLRVDNQHTIRFTYTSPAILTLHLPHAAINISAADQLDRYLMTELGRCVLERLREVGNQIDAVHQDPQNVKGGVAQWLVDKMEGTLVADRAKQRLQIKILFDKSFKLSAVAIKTAAKAESGALTDKQILRYPPEDADELSLEDWLRQIV